MSEMPTLVRGVPEVVRVESLVLWRERLPGCATFAMYVVNFFTTAGCRRGCAPSEVKSEKNSVGRSETSVSGASESSASKISSSRASSLSSGANKNVSER